MIRIAGAFVAITIAVTAVGCTREASEAQPKAAEQNKVEAGQVDVAALDPANYPTKPLPPMGNGGGRQHVAVLEANRLADVVVGPWEVDPALIRPAGIGMASGGSPILPERLQLVMDEEPAEAGKPKMITGFASHRKVDDQKMLINVVLEMKDPEAAKAAAHDMPQRMLDFASKYEFRLGTAVIPIPGHDDAFAVAATSKYQEEGERKEVTSFTARGPLVLMQRAIVSGDMAEAVSLVARVLDLQVPAIDSFTPTPPAELSNLPKDPSGVLAHALPVPPKGETFLNNATFGPRGILHYESDPIAAGKAYRDAGVDVVVIADGSLSRTRDNAAAATLAAALGDLEGPGAMTPADAVRNLPGSHCYQHSASKKYACVGAFDRYVFAVTGPRLNDVHQKAAAQYLILAAK
ncbi:hypothetical protein A5761_19375 [Mycolicibacterium setense]|uniref:DUF7373 family lipoprotein n=1 Tax=Mycolicibacterium setense TaxID=431269 RepID=UPI0007EB9E44|nr:hypothetical protein [Mycolicibacterium setense]OBB13792.1 hypothetical protein A5761_19375 [Mycolicibacterium setense]